MGFRVPTYEQRLARIETMSELEIELASAKRYMMRLRRAAKKAELLSEKLDIGQKAKEAEAVLRELRRNYFDIEDSIHAPA